MNQTVLVCGGRHYNDYRKLSAVLGEAHAANPIEYLVHGCSSGADTMAEAWAHENHVLVERYPALWEEHGRKAGPIRNQLMLDDGKPNLVIAFPGGAGTADIVRRARLAAIPVVTVT